MGSITENKLLHALKKVKQIEPENFLMTFFFIYLHIDKQKSLQYNTV